MDVRAQVSMVFHLDKCIGCHTCSVACKNVWTDRRGCEYMWWNNVESKPGTGYPTLWEDQKKYGGGWEEAGGKLRLRAHGKARALAEIFFNPRLPALDDYYEPWTYRYADLFGAPEGSDQPTARPVSQITGKPMEVEAGPNWDDDLGGSPLYAANDPGLSNLDEEDRKRLFALERIFLFYLPRICNHCLNPACVAACPAGAAYKRGEDGIVLVNQKTCRGWRMCVSGCPYKKVYYSWAGGKSEKCILCYPRLESGQAPACFHSCVGRIRYLGVLLYDAARIPAAAKAKDKDLVSAQRDLVLDPADPDVARAARACGVPSPVIESARRSPVLRFVKEFCIALPLHPEFRTLPMLFYVPPLLPVLARGDGARAEEAGDLRLSLEDARVPLKYLASLFAGGNEAEVAAAYLKLYAVRVVRRARTVGDVSGQDVARALEAGGMTEETADSLYRLTSLSSFAERFVLPPMFRESAGAGEDPHAMRGAAGTGFLTPPGRRW